MELNSRIRALNTYAENEHAPVLGLLRVVDTFVSPHAATLRYVADETYNNRQQYSIVRMTTILLQLRRRTRNDVELNNILSCE